MRPTEIYFNSECIKSCWNKTFGFNISELPQTHTVCIVYIHSLTNNFRY